jgi:hypothetical protein
MSTDIIRFPNGMDGISNGLVSGGAIRLYLALTLPLMALTFIVWRLFYQYVNRDRESQNTDVANVAMTV